MATNPWAQLPVSTDQPIQAQPQAQAQAQAQPQAQPSTGWSDAGIHNGPAPMTEEQSQAASRSPGGMNDYFPPEVNAQANRKNLQYAWNTPQHVVNTWADKLYNGLGGSPNSPLQQQNEAWLAVRQKAAEAAGNPGAASMFNPLSIAGAAGKGVSTLMGRIAGGGVGGGAYRVTQPNASIGNVAESAAFGAGLAGLGEGIGSGVSTYLHRGEQTSGGAYISPSVGFNPQTSSTTERLLKHIIGTHDIQLPPEITNGETVGDVMASVRHDPDLAGKDIADIQRIATGDKTLPATQKAEQVVQRLTYAGAGEHGVDLSLGDVSGDAQLRLREQALESKPGSVMNDFRAKQGGQLRNTVMTLRDEADTEVHGIGLKGGPRFGFEETNEELKPTLDLAVRDAQRARSAGTIGSNLTEPEILAHKISSMEANPSNPRAIQLSLEGQGWQNRQIDKLNHDSINDSINTSLEQNPNLPKTVDVGPVVSKLDDLIRQNRKSPAYSSDLDSQLNAYRSNLTGGEVKDLSYDNVHHAVSSMERTIADLKEGGNRNLVSNLQQVKNLLDFQKEKFATQTLRDQPDMLSDIRSASDFHKDNVVPYQDPDHGIRQIIEGKDPDKAVKSLFTDSSPDEFKRIFDKLDSKGQNAVRAEMIGRSEDSSTRMKNFNELNLPGMARYVENRSDQVKTAFGDDYTLAGLANLIRNTPRAGYQSKLDNLFNINSLKGLSAKSIGALGGYAAGGPVGAIAGTALETGAEIGVNRAISSHLTDPKAIDFYAEPHGAQLGSSLEPSPIRYAADEPPGPGTGMGPGGRWVGDQSQWRDTLSETPRYGGDLTRNPTAENIYSGGYTSKGALPLTRLNPMPNEWSHTKPQTWVDAANPPRTLNLDTSPTQIEALSQSQAARNAARNQIGSQAHQIGSAQAEAGQNRMVENIQGRLGHQVSGTPSYYDLNNGVLGYNNRASGAGLITPRPFSNVDVPKPEEMENAMYQLKTQLKDLMAGGQHNILGEQIAPSERAAEILKTRTDIQNLDHYMKTGHIDPSVYTERLNQYNEALRGALEESYRDGGGNPQLRDKIERLTDQRDQTAQKLIAAHQAVQSGLTQIHQTSSLGGGQWADEGFTQSGNPRRIGQIGGGEGMNTPPTRVTNPNLNGGFGHISWAGLGESSQPGYTKPSSSLNVTIPHYAEPGYSQTNAPMELGQNTHQIPILSEAPTKPGSVGAARFNPYDNGGDELAKANRVREELEQKLAANAAAKALTGQTKGAVERLSGPGQIVTPTPTSIGKTSISTGESELDAARAKMVQAQKDADRIAAAKSQVGPRMQPNPLSDNPFPPLPEPPAGKLAQVKAWLRSTLGMNPPLETTAPPAWAPLKEPTNVYMPTRSIGEAQGQLTEATEQYNTAQAKAEAAKPHGPLANPIWRREHEIVGPIELAQNPIPGTGEDPHAEVSDEELVRRVERDDPLLTKIRRKLQFTDVQKEGEEMESGTTQAEQIAAANAELTKRGKKVFSTPSGQKLDKAVTLKLLAGYGDSINHLKVEQNAEIARAQSLDASPDQLRTLSTAHEIDLKKHQDWLKDAINYVNKEDWSAYTKHLQRRP